VKRWLRSLTNICCVVAFHLGGFTIMAVLNNLQATGGELAIAITGAGGAGVISCGELILRGWARKGGRGMLRKSFGPQIRGGESAALLVLSSNECYTAATHYQLVLALDWINFDRFEDEIQVSSDTLVICDSNDTVPGSIVASGATVRDLSFEQLSKQAHPEGRANMFAVGMLAAELGLSPGDLCQLAEQKLAGKDQAYIEAAHASIVNGYDHPLHCDLKRPAVGDTDSWCVSGNQAVGFGALQAGVRFVAAYPITPASDALEWMAGGLEMAGGQLVQAEDELAAINMCLGAAFGGVPSFTATSGPGLALMTESIGLAVASETPVCILNVMRGGPSTGIPTKSEQSDLDIALHGLHGDAPHLVLAPTDIADCVSTTEWAVQLAQHLQTAAIILTDQFIAQSTGIVSPPVNSQWQAPQSTDVASEQQDYQRYQLTESGVSPRAAPGDPGRRFTADGLEHNEAGTPSARASDHSQQLDKRRRKLASVDFGNNWADIAGGGELGLISFGSTTAAVKRAAQQLADEGIAVTTVALRLLAPLQITALDTALSACNVAIVVEQNHSAQLFYYLRGCCDLAKTVHSVARAGPVPISAEEICASVREVMQA